MAWEAIKAGNVWFVAEQSATVLNIRAPRNNRASAEAEAARRNRIARENVEIESERVNARKARADELRSQRRERVKALKAAEPDLFGKESN